MKKGFLPLVLMSLFFVSGFSQISGTVYRDYNFNGSRQTSATAGLLNEPLEAGITVKATLANGAVVTTTTTSASAPNYSFSAAQVGSSGSVRIEFIINNTFDQPSKTATSGTAFNGSNVQFVIAGVGTTNVNFAVNNPSDYFSLNPLTITTYFRNGNSQDASISSQPALVGLNYDETGALQNIATIGQVGAIWGIAYKPNTKTIYAASVIRRLAGSGTGADNTLYTADDISTIYVMNNYSGTGAATISAKIDMNSFVGVNMGTNPRISGLTAHQGLGATTATSHDQGVYGTEAKRGIGDIDVSEGGNTLYVLNLNSKQLVVLNVTNPTAPTLIGAYAIPAPVTLGTDNYRPWAIGVNNGKVYVGGVMSADVSQNLANLRAYVQEFTGSSFTTVDIDASSANDYLTLNYNRTSGYYANNGAQNPIAEWRPWTDVETNTFTSLPPHPQPILSDIDFSENGSMILTFIDRNGLQGGANNYSPTHTTGEGTFYHISAGEIRKICNTGSLSTPSYFPEGTSGSCAQTQATVSFSDGSSGSSFNRFFNTQSDGSSIDGHGEIAFGALAYNKGSNSLVINAMNPEDRNDPQGGLNAYFSGGLRWFNNSTGATLRNYSIYTDANSNDPSTFGKATGLGDIELLTNVQPIEVGNRIWSDVNGNGVQEAGEGAGVAAGTTVTLRSPGPDGNYGTGDDQTWSTTTDANGNYYFNTLATADTRKPAAWTGVSGILPGYDYRVEVAIPSGTSVTKTDAATNSVDNIDNDAVQSGASAVIPFNTSNTIDNFDIGFKTLASLGDYVWLDDNKNGLQDAGEPGVAGITVTLYQNGADGNPGTSDDIIIGTTVTDAYGKYLFDNLTPSTTTATEYNVGFTLPANYQFTTQTNTQVTGTSNATNTTTLSGGSSAANGSDASTTTGRTGGFWLASGESDLTVDAGIIFTQPATNSIGDKLWFDTNADGVQDAGEAGISGVTVTLYASDGVTVVATTVTDANGNYVFTGLPAITSYIVGITPPAGFVLTSSSGITTVNSTKNSDFIPTTYKTAAFSSGAAGTQITGIDAGLIKQISTNASLGDKVWLDLNGNNLQDAGEPGVAGVTVNLYRDANGDGVISGAEATTPYATTVTDAFGNYIFNNLPAAAGVTGTFYRVNFVAPSGYTIVSPNVGANNYIDNDAYADGYTTLFSIRQGERNMSVDAGLVQTAPAGTAKLGDKVWYDSNADGVQDATETGVAGVTVTLYNSSGAAIATTVTDANGNYIFANLAAGDYSVGFSNLPQGYSFTPVWSSDDVNATNSDVNPGTARTGTIALSAGETELDVDAGLVAGTASGLGSLGNKVWWDIATNNNIQDAGEPGVPGVTVLLDYDSNGDGDFADAGETGYKTTTTNALGEYMFTGLSAGSYQVRFTNLPTGSSTVTVNSVANDVVDSDGSAVSNATGASVSTTGIYNLSAGEDNLTVDLGIINTAKSSLGNKVWFDNGAGGGIANDGILNGTEQGVAGVMVTLVNAAGQYVDRTGAVTTNPVTTTTDINGNYIFADLTVGASFAVKFSNLPAGYSATTVAGTGGTDDNRSDGDVLNYLTPATTIAAANTYYPTLDFGITSTRAALGNYVWMDDNGNGLQDGTEAGVAGVTVSLYYDANNDGDFLDAGENLPVASMITDQNGQYLFSNLLPGNYQVEYSTIPGGTSFTQNVSAGDNQNNTNSDAVATSSSVGGRTATIALSAGETDLTVDAGLFKPRAVIGNYVWVDSNNDGVQDGTEPVASGIMVSLVNTATNQTVAIAITDANGNYMFPNVAPGTYNLVFTNLPAGAGFTIANSTLNGGTDNTDSDATIAGVISGIIVTTTTTDLSFDAGLVSFLTLPAEGLKLSASLHGGKVNLNWQTISELNTAYFEVERSTDNASFIKTGGRVAAAGYSALPQNYSAADDASALSSGKVFYRIKLYDADGKVHYSNVAVVWLQNNGQLKVWPNPFAQTLQVSFTATASGTVQLRLSDAAGRTLLNKTQTVAAGSNQINLNGLNSLSSGSYILSITDQSTNQTTTYKLTKQ